jgi:hypothetical protein
METKSKLDKAEQRENKGDQSGKPQFRPCELATFPPTSVAIPAEYPRTTPSNSPPNYSSTCASHSGPRVPLNLRVRAFRFGTGSVGTRQGAEVFLSFLRSSVHRSLCLGTPSTPIHPASEEESSPSAFVPLFHRHYYTLAVTRLRLRSRSRPPSISALNVASSAKDNAESSSVLTTCSETRRTSARNV